MKLLRARQKKNDKMKAKNMKKDIKKLDAQIDGIKAGIDSKKAQAYAEQASGALVEGDIAQRMDRVTGAVANMFSGF
jgi:peptidoglycan hydrolase CwlO-like protein